MIGVGITTRNRPHVLEWSLRHFDTYHSKNESKFIIVDDNSTSDNAELNKNICKKYNIEYVFNDDRLGVAKTKNISANNLQTKFLFLFDDDTYPRRSGWDQHFILTYKKTNIEHFCYIREVDHIKRIYKNDDIEIFKDCLGSCCFFTKNCFDKLNGFDEEYGIFGFEHADISQRAFLNGFCGKLAGYYSPKNTQKFIYGLDTDYKTLKELTELGDVPFEFKSSTNNEPVNQYINDSLRIFNRKRKF